MDPKALAILKAIEERLTAIEDAIAARSAPAEEIRQALHDILQIYSTTGQTAEVVSQQRDQIQAFAEAMTRFHELLLKHDAGSTEERSEIMLLMVQVRELARTHVQGLSDIRRAVGADLTPKERAKTRDVRPEEKE